MYWGVQVASSGYTNTLNNNRNTIKLNWSSGISNVYNQHATCNMHSQPQQQQKQNDK